MGEEIRQIQIRFTEVDEKHGSYSDAIYYPLEEFEKITQDEIDKEKQTRLENWVSVIENPPPAPEPEEKTVEDLQEEKAQAVLFIESLQEQISQYEDKIVEVDTQIAEIVEVAQLEEVAPLGDVQIGKG